MPGLRWQELGALGRTTDERGLWLKLLLIVAAAAVLRAIFFAGLAVEDDTHYIERAHQISIGEFGRLDMTQSARLGLVLPPALAFAAVGVSEVTAVYWPFLCSVLAPLAAFALGRRLFSAPVGLLAALLLVVFPLELIFASQLSASVITGLFSCLALLAFLRGEQTARPRDSFLAGLALGVATIVHEASVLCLIFYALYALMIRRPVWRDAFAALGLVLVCLLDPLFYALLAGDPFAHWRVLSGGVLARGFADVIDAGLNVDWLLRPFARLLTEQEFGLFPYFYVPVAVMALARPSQPNQRILALWVVSVFLWVCYGPVSPFSYVTLPRHPRYLSVITIPALVLLANWLINAVRPRVARIVVAVLCVTSLFCAFVDAGRERAQPFRQLGAYLLAHRPEAFAAKPSVIGVVLFYEAFEPPFLTYELCRAKSGSGKIALERKADAAIDERSAPQFFEIATDDATIESDLEAAGGTRIAEFARPESLRAWLLARPVVVELLSLGRDEYRMAALRATEAPLRLYRVPSDRCTVEPCSE